MKQQTMRKIFQPLVISALALGVLSGPAYASEGLGGEVLDVVESTTEFGAEITGEGLEATGEILEDTGDFLTP